MTNLVVEISKYLIILLIALYTCSSFRFFAIKDDAGRNRACSRQLVCLFMLHFLANLVIFANTGSFILLGFYAAQAVFFALYTLLFRVLYPNASRILVNHTCLLLATGFIILTRLNPEEAMRQFVIAAAAAVGTWLIPFLIDRVWQLVEVPYVYGVLGIILLLAVFAVGQTSYGAQLALTVGNFTVQPSEFVKISFVFFVAAMYYQSTDRQTVLRTTAIAAAHVLILAASKDLGSALIYFVTYLVMLFTATGDWRLLGAGGAGGAAAALLASRLFSHVQRRVQAWLDPWSDVEDVGYQTAQALFAIGTGGWFGTGLYLGMPEKIPVVDKDFIFAAIFEELGGIYAVCLLFVCLGCFLQFMIIASKMQAMFYKLLALGLGTMYITQVFLTVGGVIKFIPMTGVTLPFVSYGGSSLLSTFIIFNVIQGLYILKRGEEDDEADDSPDDPDGREADES